MTTIKPLYKYIMKNNLKSIFIFYIIMTAIIHIGFFICKLSNGSSGGIGGMEIATIFLLFSLVLCSYRETMNLSVQCGVSRKTVFISSLLAFITCGIITGTMDLLLSLLGNFYESRIGTFTYDSMYEQTFMPVGVLPKFNDFLKVLLMCIGVNTATLIIAFLIGALNYRLSKTMKVIIPISIFVFIFVIFPIVDYTIFDMEITKQILKLLRWTFSSVYHTLVFAAVTISAALAMTYLFIRRVKIDDKR